MTIQYCSDLHLEFPVNKKYLEANPITPKGEILLLAGDIVPFAVMENERPFFDFVSGNFEQVYWVAGNHEYYRSDIHYRTGGVHEKIRENVSLVNNVSIPYKNVRLIFSTLWTKIDPVREWVVQKTMSDFHLIQSNGKKIAVPDYNKLHDASREFLSNAFQTKTEQPTIVVSHHVPTLFHYPEKYRHSELNSAFAVELYDLIESSPVDYWIYGHNHSAVPDFKINRTTLTTNQLGYVEYGEHFNFQKDRVIKIS
ncbi:metallophosphoesterase [Chryseolinea soli]|uniref:Metallophosphoesterase n=1 Tax=Chryseolinea soli TaxID=2321403 RepID=A0A385SQ08_9BACT|nr:metallophosphoesterase [Chryseolinea soli]AYB31590.1 metallophosphoesterase [Chryseolinea soli]